ncbi:AAA family ATPase [Falsiroseomonas sp. E2-1-a20]|uniref:AAA family ATPase n=1 Tax=Falsiroseomonas sp. E2-1-a20 TaxID=3239300 RepID=UPI003F340012
MRLLRLELLRYGHLTDARLDFPPEAPLVVVLGANEAGKSTALSAIGDALFGFPQRSPYAFLHDTAQLRLGFEVAGQDGSRAAFIRRKGRKDTLRDAADSPVPEGALLRLLGGAGRDLFETTYGLNGDALRRGALSLLASGGEAGESLLAGMGLPNLRKALDRLDSEAKTLHGDGRGRRALAAATEAWSEKRRAAEDATVQPRAWLAAKTELDGLYEQVDANRRQASMLATEAARLNRLRRVLPLLTALAASRAELAEVADAPTLPANAATTLATLVEERRQAAEDRRREQEEAERLAAEQDALPQDPAVLALQDEIDLLAEQRVAALNAARDLPEVLREVDRYRAEVLEAAAQLGTAATPEAVRDALPSPADRRRAQTLIRRRTALATALEEATEALRQAGRAHAECRDRLDAATPDAAAPPSSAPLRRAIEAARGEGPLDRELAAAERALAVAAGRVATALAALPLWTGTAEALAACKLPLQPAAEAAAQHLAAAHAESEQAQAAAAGLRAEIAELEAAIAHLARGETVPTRAVIAAERARRDAAWRRIRAALEDGAPDAPPDPDAFEDLRDAADRLADARADDAARVNDYAAKSARLDLLRGRRAEAEAAQAAADSRAGAAEAAWQALWALAGLTPSDPPAMAEWRRVHAEILRLAGLEAEARQKRDELASRLATTRDRLAGLLPAGAADPTLAGVLAEAQDRLAEAEAAETAHRTLATRLADAAERLDAARARHSLAAGELAAFEAEWRPAALALDLPAEASAEMLESALGAWTRVAEAATAWHRDAARVADMQRTVAEFAGTTSRLLAALGAAGPDEAAPLAVARLARRLAEAREASRAAADLAQRLQQRRRALAEATARHDAAERGLSALRQAAGAADLPALEAAIRRAARREALHAEIALQSAELLRQGDGGDEATLRAEAAAADPDQARARLDQIEAEQAALRDSLASLGAARQAAEASLESMRAGHDSAGLAQEARHHLAEAGAAAERYARLHLARSLLAAGIERIRAERQAPLLRAASRHFALLTEGRYASLTTDEDDAGRTTLRAVRDSGPECPVEALSEGTRDQLYLALRVAAVEAHAAGTEPLPFIADDLLATFDDARADLALAMLARLGRTTQTILFTHHAHIADLARRQPGVAVRELPRPAAA